MEQPKHFRSALSGFNREDVAHYLEYMNTKHAQEMSQLSGDLNYLQQKLNEVDPDRMSELTDRCEALEQKLSEAEEAREAAEARAAEAEERIRALEKELAEAKQNPAQPIYQDSVALYSAKASQELEAYRRAERAEREAKARAEQVYRRTNTIITDAGRKVDEASVQICSVTDQVTAQLNLLQSAVNSSRLALQEAAITLAALRSESEE